MASKTLAVKHSRGLAIQNIAAILRIADLEGFSRVRDRLNSMAKEMSRQATNTYVDTIKIFAAHYGNWIGAAVLVLAFLSAVVAIGPVHEFPMADDWDYARTARQLAETGIFQRSEYSQATLILHAVVGALVIHLFGFSFTALRFSTLALALLTLFAVYALLLELQFDPLRSVIGALTLLVIPEFVYLAFSYMTDIPALCWLTIALFFYVRALQRSDARWAWLASIFAALVFLVRQTGILAPLAFLAVIVWRMPRAQWATYSVAGCLIPLLVLVVYIFLPGQNTLTNWGTQSVTLGLTWNELVSPGAGETYLRRAVQSLLWLGFYVIPLGVAFFHPRAVRYNLSRLRGALLVGVILAVTLVVVHLGERGEWFPYFFRAGMRPYLSFVVADQGGARGAIFPTWFVVALTALAALAGIVLAGIAIQKFHSNISMASQFILVLTALIGLTTLFFGIWYERYLLPLMLGAIMLLLDASRRERFAPYFSAWGFAALALFSWALMQDYWSWNEARWQIGHQLLAQNIPAREIDAGYEWDGWYMYEKAAQYVQNTGKPLIIEPWRYVIDPQYALAFQPARNYRIERVIVFASPFAENKFYLLHRE